MDEAAERQQGTLGEGRGQDCATFQVRRNKRQTLPQSALLDIDMRQGLDAPVEIA